MKKQKSIPTAELRRALMLDIGLWLNESEKAKAEDRSNAFEEEMRCRSMAHALYLYGRGLGLVSAEDYPQFGRREGQP